MEDTMEKCKMPRSLFGVIRKSSEVSICFDFIEIADDIIGEVGGQLAHNGDFLDTKLLQSNLTEANKFLLAAHSALAILDNPDWTDDLAMAEAGLRVVARLREVVDRVYVLQATHGVAQAIADATV